MNQFILFVILVPIFLIEMWKKKSTSISKKIRFLIEIVIMLLGIVSVSLQLFDATRFSLLIAVCIGSISVPVIRFPIRSTESDRSFLEGRRNEISVIEDICFCFTSTFLCAQVLQIAFR